MTEKFAKFTPFFSKILEGMAHGLAENGCWGRKALKRRLLFSLQHDSRTLALYKKWFFKIYCKRLFCCFRTKKYEKFYMYIYSAKVMVSNAFTPSDSNQSFNSNGEANSTIFRTLKSSEPLWCLKQEAHAMQSCLSVRWLSSKNSFMHSWKL